MYDNLITSDHLEQVVQKIQNTKASKSTTLSGYGITDSYTKTETDNRIQDIVGAAPEALDTLEEIAEALQDGESTAAGLVQTLSQKADKSTTVTNIAYGSKKLTKTINGSTTDVVTINAIKSDLALTKSDVGLSNVDNTSDVNKPVSNATQTALDTKVDKVSGKGLSTNDYTTTEKNKLSGIASNAQVNIIESIKVNNSVLPISSKSVTITVPTKTSELTNNSNFAVDSNYVHTDNNYTTAEKQKLASKVAELDNNGKVLSSQLPSYVDDVVEYTSLANFPTTGESGKIYVDTGTNLTYRWTGSAYREISPSLALGETSSTAYRGDRGKVAYAHATDSNRLTTAKTSGLYKISTTTEGHVASAETATKSDIGLGNVDNTSDLDKPISTATQEALNTKVNATTSVLKSDEEFIYRQTDDGSLDIDAKYGKLKSIKGRTLVWNQKTDTIAYNSSVVTLDTSVTTEKKYNYISSTTSARFIYGVGHDVPDGHKVLIQLVFKNGISSGVYFRFRNGSDVYENIIFSEIVQGEWAKVSVIRDNGFKFLSQSGFLAYGDSVSGDYFSMPNNGGLSVFDLTLMFGAGNEPTTPAEFEALYPRFDYEYNTGKLINNGLQSEYDLTWNQLIELSYGTTTTINSVSAVIDSGGKITLNGTASTSGGRTIYLSSNVNTVPIVSGHKYINIGECPLSAIPFITLQTQTSTTLGFPKGAIVTALSTFNGRFGFNLIENDNYDNISFYIGIVDLTLMFGAGNEPTTAEEFYEMFPTFNPVYDTGTQQHFSFPQFKTKIETVGWNIWDEEWENGFYDSEGSKKAQASAWRNKEPIRVLPNTTYYSTYIMYRWYYDADMNLVSTDSSGHTPFTTPSNAYYLNIGQTIQAGGPTSSVCISLSDPSRNGTYEPYWRSELELGLGDIKVKSHNLWDEEWEVGAFNTSTGEKSTATNTIRSKNYIPVLPSTTYYASLSPKIASVYYYDSNKAFISFDYNSSGTRTTPANCYYIMFVGASSYGTTYLNDICINLSDPAFNGRYEPYGDGGVISITGGLKSAGVTYDEISGGKLVKRIESMDLGSLTYSYDSSINTFAGAHGLSSIAKHGAVAICAKYTQVSSMGSSTPDKVFAFMSSWSGYNYIHFKDTSYSDAATFKASMSGVPLYYELAQPIEYELYNPIDLSYKVDKFGTEKLLPESTSAIVSSPFRADIEYRTTNVTIDDVYGGSDIIKSVEDVDSRLTTVEKSINGLVTIGSGSPTTIPKNIGDFYIDVTNKVLYFATGNQLISDWNS